ncbi:hypothetical protein Droror1_Dr00021406 [Drosera rotundifolia]
MVSLGIQAIWILTRRLCFELFPVAMILHVVIEVSFEMGQFHLTGARRCLIRRCFLGVKLDRKLGALQCSWVLTSEGIYLPPPLKCKTGVEVDELAARVLKKQSLRGQRLADVAREAGFRYDPPQGRATGVADLGVKILLDDEVKSTVYDAYMCFKIGKKLVGSL